MGGAYFCVNFILNKAVLLVAVHLYLANEAAYKEASSLSALVAGDSSSLRGSLTPVALYTLVGGSWLVSFVAGATLAATIVPSYRHTFYNSMTAKAFVCSTFTDRGATDETRFNLFCRHPRMYHSIQDKVVEYVQGNWERLERLEPDWWTELVKRRVPDVCVPADSLRVLNLKGPGGERRRSSFFGLEGEGGGWGWRSSGKDKVKGKTNRKKSGGGKIAPSGH